MSKRNVWERINSFNLEIKGSISGSSLHFFRHSNLVKGATSRFVQVENFSVNFSSLLFVIRVNLLHHETSSFLFSLFLSLWCLVNYYLKVSLQLTTIFNDPKKQLKISQCCFFKLARYLI